MAVVRITLPNVNAPRKSESFAVTHNELIKAATASGNRTLRPARSVRGAGLVGLPLQFCTSIPNLSGPCASRPAAFRATSLL